MNSPIRRPFALAATLGFAALLTACTDNPAPPPSADRSAERKEERRDERREERREDRKADRADDRSARRSGDVVADFAAMFAGRYDGVTPGNNLHVDIQSAGFHSLSHPYDLFLEVTGQFEGTNVRQAGFLHLEQQGPGVYIGYIPHYDPTITAMSPRAGRFSASEENAACQLSLKPEGDGFAGDNQGQTCAFAIRGAIGNWNLRVEPGEITVRSQGSGETLRFRRARS